MGSLGESTQFPRLSEVGSYSSAMAISTPGLDRLAEMQRQPLGTFSALRRPSPVATQYKRQSEMYGQALRNLSRAARRGDAGAAIDAIKYRDQANEDGFMPGGIRRSEDVPGAIRGREIDRERMTQDLERKDALSRRPGSVSLSRDTVNPGATSGYDSDANGIPDMIQRGPVDVREAPATQSVGASLAVGRNREDKLAALKASWMNQERANDPTRMQSAYEKENGTPEQQAEQFAPSTRYDSLVDKYKGQFPGLERTKGISDADKASAVKTGKEKGDAYGRKFDKTTSRARDSVALARMDVAGRQTAVADMRREVAGIREGNQNTLRSLERTADNRQRATRKPTLEELNRQAALRFSRGR